VTLKAQIENDLKTALLGGDRFRGEVLRGLKAVILNEEVAKGKRDTGLDDTEIEQIVAKEIKKRADSITLYVQANRQELADNEKAESEILAVYLPDQLSEETIAKKIDEAIAAIGASDASKMGQVIGAVKKELGTSADGAVIARIVKEKLS
jgi:uncharacterized protein YqeY